MFGGPSSFGGQFATQLQSMQSQLDPANANQFGTTTLDGMIDDINIANEAKKRGITVSADEINKSMESAFNYFPNGTPSPTVTPTTGATSTLSALQMTLVPPTPTETTTPTPAATETPIPATSTPTPEPTKPGATPTITQTPTITPTATPYTFQGYQTQVSDYANQLKSTGFTEADIRAMVKAQLLRQKVEDAITVNVKPHQEQVWARDIELPDETSAIAARARLTKGEDFATVAKAVSTDTATKDLGGDMGWFPAGQKDPAIDTAAFSLKIGEISQPIKGASGYYIIQVLGHELRPLTDSEFQALRQEDFQKWLDTARTAKDVQIFDFYLQHVPTEPTLSPNEQIPQ
jgi:peptidyl-prolyl cis-trans isomerase D